MGIRKFLLLIYTSIFTSLVDQNLFWTLPCWFWFISGSVDQFFECIDGLRNSQSALGNSGMWNWTCSVFSAITAASNLASGSLHVPPGKSLQCIVSNTNLCYSSYYRICNYFFLLLFLLTLLNACVIWLLKCQCLCRFMSLNCSLKLWHH